MTWLRRRPKERRLEAGELPVRWPDPDPKNPDKSQFLITPDPTCPGCGKCPTCGRSR
jgi:hypothetical protein